MTVFIDYRKKSYEFDVKESMTVNELKELIANECMVPHFEITDRPPHQSASSTEDYGH